MVKCLSFYFVLLLPFISGCAAKTHEVITCYPPYADIYWGKNPSELTKTGFSTPHSRSISGAEREHWCYQVKKDGYKDSDVLCRDKEGSRNLDFYLVPLETTITSKPTGATIYWGPTRDQLEDTKRVTPQTITIRDVSEGASWKDWCYQAKKEGYQPSEVVCLAQQSFDRHVNFELKSIAGGQTVLGSKVLSNQKDKSPTEYKEGYRDSEVAVLPQQSGDRHLKSKSKSVAGGEAALSSNVALIKRDISPTEYTVSGSQVTLTWEDTS